MAARVHAPRSARGGRELRLTGFHRGVPTPRGFIASRRVGSRAHPTNPYLPMQNRLKITPSKSSGVNAPVMLDN